MIFQEPMTSLNPLFTVGDQIGEMIALHEPVDRREARKRALAMLKHVEIPDAESRLDDYPHQMSGGMRQRVMIAMALSCNPKVLIADEPTTALDVTIQAQILALMRELQQAYGMAMVLITHDMGVVAENADRVIVMYAGRKVEEGLPDVVFETPYHPYTQGLLAASPRLNANYHYRDGRLSEIPGSVVSAAGETGCSFRPRCPVARASCSSSVPPLLHLPAGRQVACPFGSSLTEAAHAVAIGR